MIEKTAIPARNQRFYKYPCQSQEKDGIVVSVKFAQFGGTAKLMIEYYIANIDADIERTDDKEILKDL